MHWFKKYTSWYQSESELLQNCPYYKEACQTCDNIFISMGIMIVNSRKTYKQPIIIIYPEYSPFHYPKVILLRELLDDTDLFELAKKDFVSAVNFVKGKVIFFDQIRHQMSDGSLCILDYDNLYDETPGIIPIKDILKRVREWLVCTITNRYPKESPEISVFFHFHKQESNYKFLLPELFFKKDYSSGEIYLSRVDFFDFERIEKFYIGAFFLGYSGNIILPKKEDSEIYNTVISKQIEYDDIIPKYKPEIIERINNKKIIKIFWWDISKIPDPFSSIDELMGYIGNGNREEGFQKVKHIKEFNQYSDEIHLGLRFVNHKNEFEWLILKLVPLEYVPILLNDGKTSTEDTFLTNLRNKFEIKAIYSECFTDTYFHQRNSILSNRNLLKEKSITIIGCGAIGSEVSDNISKAGVGNIVLVDNQILTPKNIIRHLCGLDKVNLNKVSALTYENLLHNPFIKTIPVKGNILQSDIRNYFEENGIGISTIADDNTEAYLNEQAIEHNKTIFYCRSLRGGRTARIFRVIPKFDACKNCLSLYHKEKNTKFHDIPYNEELGTIRNECNNPIRPASAAELKLIASLASRILIDFLQTRNEEKNHWIWTSENLENFPDFGENIDNFTLSDFIEPHPDCHVCQKRNRKNIIISETAKNIILNECKASNELETGGVLTGYTDKDSIIITNVSGPGPESIRERNKFIKDKNYCNDFLEKEYSQRKQEGNYVGEWHFHPSGSNMPSKIDLNSLEEISMEKEYLTTEPIMIIVSNNMELSGTVHPSSENYYHVKIENK